MCKIVAKIYTVGQKQLITGYTSNFMPSMQQRKTLITHITYVITQVYSLLSIIVPNSGITISFSLVWKSAYLLHINIKCKCNVDDV
jgi:hypothetical protein